MTLKISFDCQRCGKEFLRNVGYRGLTTHCSLRCHRAESTKRVKKVITAKILAIGKCQKCGAMSELHGHHILHRAHAPLLAEDPNNIEVLCQGCHADEHPELSVMNRWRRKAVAT